MIKNHRQYGVTKTQASKLAEALTRETRPRAVAKVHPLLRKAQTDALRSQLADLQTEIKQYEALRSGKRTKLAVDSIDDLPRALIQGRIASGLTQKELAERLGLKEQQIQRYEATNYASASLARVCEVAKSLGLKVKAEASVVTDLDEAAATNRFSNTSEQIMGIVREPDGVDFVVSSGRWSPEVSAEVAEFFRQLRQSPACLPITVARAPAAADIASPDSSDRKPVAASS